MAYAVRIERYMTSKVKKNALTETVKYRFDKLAEAYEFANDISKIDNRIESVMLEKIDG